MTYPTDDQVEALARFLSEQPDGMEHRYCTDDGLSVPANTPEWTLRVDFARAALRAAAKVLDREVVRQHIDAAWINTDHAVIDYATDAILASAMTREEVKREVLERLRAKLSRYADRDPKYDAALGVIEVELAEPVEPDDSDMEWAAAQIRSQIGEG